jgi:hypothetical protein
MSPDEWADGYDGEVRFWANTPFTFYTGVGWVGGGMPEVEIIGESQSWYMSTMNWILISVGFAVGFLTKMYFFKKW